jgi:pilus assembly protein Flp/PilA
MVRTILKRTVEFLKREDGPTAVEYAVMLALIIVVCVAAVTALGSNVNATFANSTLKTALTPS